MNEAGPHQGDADRYAIVEYLAEGGMGAIFVGERVGPGGFAKRVVLKQLLPELTARREFIQLFLREAKLSASLDHANIVHTIDLVAAGSDYFMVMEYVDGADLRAILRLLRSSRKRLPAAACLFIAREVLNALVFAHGQSDGQGTPLSLIHRDISPSNLLLSINGEVKLTDFGIAKVSTHDSAFYRVRGKHGYMSPEQVLADREIDHRSDLYSLAVCLFEMLSGERLFSGDPLGSAEDIYARPPPPLEDQPGMPRGIDRLLAKALAVDPDQRYPNAAALREAVMDVVYAGGISYGSAELSRDLSRLIGPDPAQWRAGVVQASSEAAQTGLTHPSGDLSAFSGLQLTSVLQDAITTDADDDETTVAPADWHGAETDVAPRVHDELEGTGMRREAPRVGWATDATHRPRDVTRDRRQRFAVVVASSIAATLAVAIVAAIAVIGSGRRQKRPAPKTPVTSATQPAYEPALPPVVEPLGALERGSAAGTPHPFQPRSNARLHIVSSPTGAVVYVEGRRRCRTPCTIRGLSRSALHVISVRRSGYLKWSRLFTAPGRIHARLRRRPRGRRIGYLQIDSAPPAQVIVDGRDIAWVTSQGRIPLRPGKRVISLSHPHHERTLRFTLVVRRGKTTVVKKRL